MTEQVVDVEVKEEKFEDIGKYAGDGSVIFGVFLMVVGSAYLTPVVGIPTGIAMIMLGKIISLLRLIRLDLRNQGMNR